MTDFEKSPYWALLRDTVKFFRSRLPPTLDKELWDEICAEAAALAERYVGTPEEPFCNALLEAMLYELARYAQRLADAEAPAPVYAITPKTAPEI